MLAIVVSEYGLPRPRRRPMRPRSTPSSQSSPSEPKGGPRPASSARWSAPLDTEPSQTRTSPRSFIVLLQVGFPDTGSRRRPRQDGLQRQRASASSWAGQDLECATYTLGVRVLRQFAIYVPSGHRGKVAPRGTQG